ncbi:MAG: hypothetical protein JWN54_2542, partial [Mycobacterium sp.]|nr:hypothetical protein [Mycobacterium sp.]
MSGRHRSVDTAEERETVSDQRPDEPLGGTAGSEPLGGTAGSEPRPSPWSVGAGAPPAAPPAPA